MKQHLRSHRVRLKAINRPFSRHTEIQPNSQQQRQYIRHRLRPDQSCFVKDRAEDEHSRNVDKPLTGDIDDQGFRRCAAGLQRVDQHIEYAKQETSRCCSGSFCLRET